MGFACPLIFDGNQPPSAQAFIDVLKRSAISSLDGVFLNACSTGAYAMEISASLAAYHAVRVVAWDGEPSDKEAYVFARQLYRAMADHTGAPVDYIFSEALKKYDAFWRERWGHAEGRKHIERDYDPQVGSLAHRLPSRFFLRPILASEGQVKLPAPSPASGGKPEIKVPFEVPGSQ